jgi:membrane-associated phospholipid phosphatase
MTEPQEPLGPGHADPPSDRLADRLEARPTAPAPPVLRVLRELGAVDRAVYRAVAATPTPTIDAPMRRFTTAADHSKLWVGTAAVLFVVGGPKGRRAALTGLVSIAATSVLVNLPLKLAGARRRPDADAAGVPESRRVAMPTSASFPSGHSASAAAFSAGVSSVVPALGAPLGCAAATVGYSRVHSGVHYPGDVVAGVVVGATIGEVVAWAGEHLVERRRRARGER